jgi:uncharacterized protein
MLTMPLALAALSAGLAGGVHCIGMCGGFASLLSKTSEQTRVVTPSLNTYRTIAITPLGMQQPSTKVQQSGVLQRNLTHQVLLHSGRLFTYMLIGAMLGGFGSAGLLFAPYLPMQRILFIIGNLALLMLGLRLLGWRLSEFVGWHSPRNFIFKNFLQQRWWKKYLNQGFLRGFSLSAARRYPFMLGMGWGGLPCGLLYSVAPFAWLAGDPISGAVVMLLFGLSALPHLLVAQGLATSKQLPFTSPILRKACALGLISVGLVGLYFYDMKGMPSFLCIT